MSTTSPLIGITAEWNPFHAGHSAMIDIIKKAYPQAPPHRYHERCFRAEGRACPF